jgi:hypothetical protein
MAAAHAAALHVQLASMDVFQIVHENPQSSHLLRRRPSSEVQKGKRYTSTASSLVQAHVRTVNIDR